MRVRGLIAEVAKPIAEYYEKRKAEDPLACAEFNAGIRALLDFAEEELNGGGRKLGRPMRLSDLMERYELARTYKKEINATVELGASGAITLTTAHGSKGLEFDLVYLLDADNDTWHKGLGSGSYFPSNMLVGDEKDEDDARRLLFVAVTRAKRLLEVYRGPGTLVQELQGLVEEGEVAADPEEIDDVIETSWEQAFALDTPELVSLLEPIAPEHLSASALNDFVEYEPGCPNSLEFARSRVLRLPQEPAIALEFGNTVHLYLEGVVNRVAGADDVDPGTLASEFHEKVLGLDFDRDDVASYGRRFERIAETFTPWLVSQLEGSGLRLMTEAEVKAHVGEDDVPLYGKCDLLLVDESAKTVRIVDYKTGFNYDGSQPKAGYLRQLQFYKLLIESSPKFEGYHVMGEEDLFVEPEKGSENDLHDPDRAAVDAFDSGHLVELIGAVWRRIQAGDYDTSAFEESDLYAALKAEKGDKKPSKGEMQPVYEQWLIENS